MPRSSLVGCHRGYVYIARDYPSNTSDHAPIVTIIDKFLAKSTENQVVPPKIQRYEWGQN